MICLMNYYCQFPTRQKKELKNEFNNNMSTDIRFSKAQISMDF